MAEYLVDLFDFVDEYNVPGGYTGKIQTRIIDPHDYKHSVSSTGTLIWYLIAIILLLICCGTSVDLYYIKDIDLDEVNEKPPNT